MTEITDPLELVGDALQRAWRRDHLNRQQRSTASRRRPFVVASVFSALVLGGGAAIASSLLKSPADEQTSMIEGYRLFEGSQPTCESLSPSSFHCTLKTPPTGETFYYQDGTQALDLFLGIKAETVDKNRRVDGGCVSVSADGRSWDCYLGEAAVAHGIISRTFLGTYLPEPPTA